MNQLNKNNVGLTLGSFYLLCHAGWVLMVALGAAKSVLDWLLSLHFLAFTYTVQPFQFMPAILLTGVAFLSGYVMGWVLAALWNRFAR